MKAEAAQLIEHTWQLQAGARNAVLGEVLLPPDGAASTVGLSQVAADAVVTGARQRAFDCFRRLVPRGTKLDGQTLFIENLPEGEVRAKYSMTDHSIYLAPTSRAATIIHEFAHSLEDFDPTVLRKAQAFRASYRTSDRAQALTTLMPGKPYRSDEVAYPGTWPHPYCGKEAGPKSTEIVSMGVQLLVQDPVTFARGWPEYFDLIWGILSGKP